LVVEAEELMYVSPASTASDAGNSHGTASNGKAATTRWFRMVGFLHRYWHVDWFTCVPPLPIVK
jgi:hypothetical protein